ncbi:MAG: hypothetical protein CMH53_05350 [Myxococcales bacterium]|nr:hypothetical protein [Myxococcales bacterium]
MPKDSKAKRAAVLGVHNDPATFRAVLDRFRWMRLYLKGQRQLAGDFLTQSDESPLRNNLGLHLDIRPRSVKNHRQTTKKLDKDTLKQLSEHMYRPRAVGWGQWYLNLDVTASIPCKPKFAKGETMHIVGIGNGDWKLTEAAPKAEEVVDQHGGFIGKLTPSQRSVLQHGCTQCDPTTAGTCVDCVALREKGLLDGPE